MIGSPTAAHPSEITRDPPHPMTYGIRAAGCASHKGPTSASSMGTVALPLAGRSPSVPSYGRQRSLLTLAGGTLSSESYHSALVVHCNNSWERYCAAQHNDLYGCHRAGGAQIER